MAEPARTLLRTLTLPYEAVRTLYEGDTEVRLYRNELTGGLEVGKRIGTIGLESILAVREATLLEQIRHPHVAPIRSVAVVSGYDAAIQVIELIMPWYERGSVFDAFERGERFSVGQAISLASDCLLGVSELHDRHRVLHRDIKSPNVFLGDEDRAVVGDLGVAVPMDENGMAEPLPNARIYSPPEMFVRATIDKHAEIYQVGLVLHELASGPLPYGDPSLRLEAVATRLGNGRPGPGPAHLVHAPWVPSRLRRVINRALRPAPEGRFGSATEMLEALARVPYVDWALVRDEPEFKRWEGATVRRPDRRFAVEAEHRGPTRRRTTGGWILRGQQRVTRWQRVRPDELASELSSTQAARFFSTIVDIAIKS